MKYPYCPDCHSNHYEWEVCRPMELNKEMFYLSDEEIEKTICTISSASIGYNGRRLTRHQLKWQSPDFRWHIATEPTPIEFGREISHTATNNAIKKLVEYCLKNSLLQHQFKNFLTLECEENCPACKLKKLAEELAGVHNGQ